MIYLSAREIKALPGILDKALGKKKTLTKEERSVAVRMHKVLTGRLASIHYPGSGR